jgi:hypothetical protein
MVDANVIHWEIYIYIYIKDTLHSIIIEISEV